MAIEKDFETDYLNWKQDPNPTHTGTLLKKLQPVISSSIRTFALEDSPLTKSRARLLAADAIKSYDPSKAQLRTHVMNHLQGLRRITAQHAQLIHIPEAIALDKKHLLESELELRESLGRDPSDAELSANTHLSLKRIAKIRLAHSAVAEGATDNLATGGVTGADMAVNLDDQTGWREFVYHSLPPTDQLILEHSLGLHGKPQLSNQDIARKLGVTPAAVSQRRTRIQDQLDMRDDLGVI